MKIQNRYNESTIVEDETKTVKTLAEENSANLYGANLYGANLRGANLRGADLREAYLRGADLREAYLREADLYGADLRGADLYGADLRGADLRGANLRGADLRGADLCGAKYNEDEILQKYLTIGPIGSRNDYLQIFITTKQTILKTGCFSGNIEEFKIAVNDTHEDNEHAKHYILAISLIESMIATKD